MARYIPSDYMSRSTYSNPKYTETTKGWGQDQLNIFDKDDKHMKVELSDIQDSIDFY